jgi:hypothetical protein
MGLYSYEIIDAPELPLTALPTIPPMLNPISTEATSTPTPSDRNELSNQYDESLSESLNDETGVARNPIKPMVVGIVPAIILITGIIVMKRLFRR